MQTLGTLGDSGFEEEAWQYNQYNRYCQYSQCNQYNQYNQYSQCSQYKQYSQYSQYSQYNLQLLLLTFVVVGVHGDEAEVGGVHGECRVALLVHDRRVRLVHHAAGEGMTGGREGETPSACECVCSVIRKDPASRGAPKNRQMFLSRDGENNKGPLAAPPTVSKVTTGV